MESHLKHPEDNTSLEREDHDQHVHGEKQSVLKKVKAKAKKIKDKIKNHGHHHGHEQHPESHHEQDDDEYEEMEKDPEVHGAPIYDSEVVRNPNVGLGPGSQGLMHHHLSSETTDEHALRKDHTDLCVPTSHTYEVFRPELEKLSEKSPVEDLGVPKFGLIEQTHPVSEKDNISYPTDAVYGSQVARNPTMGLEGNQGFIHNQTDLERTDQPSLNNTRLGIPTSLGPEGVTPEFGKAEDLDLGAPKHILNDTPRPDNHRTKVNDSTYAGVKEAPGAGQLFHSLEKMTISERRHDHMDSGSPGKYRDMPVNSPLLTGEAVEQTPQVGGYGEKLAYATAALADKVSAAKDVAAAKLGYGDDKGDKTLDESDQNSYTEKALSAASLLAGKAAGVKDTVASKLGYGGVEEHKTPREPVDHDALMVQQHGGYMDKVSGVTSSLAEKAVTAKNVVASKLGYNQTGEDASSVKPTSPNPTGVKNALASKLGYDQSSEVKSSAQLTSLDNTSEPTIVDKAAQLKKVVASKLGYGVEGDRSTETSTWTEKLKPGDDDKALSELITESIYKGSPKQTSDSNQHGEVMTTGKVTESEAVAQRLGTSEERKGDLTHNLENESQKKAVVDKIKVAVSSLWSSGDAHINITQDKADEPSAGVRRLQESAN